MFCHCYECGYFASVSRINVDWVFTLIMLQQWLLRLNFLFFVVIVQVFLSFITTILLGFRHKNKFGSSKETSISWLKMPALLATDTDGNCMKVSLKKKFKCMIAKCKEKHAFLQLCHSQLIFHKLYGEHTYSLPLLYSLMKVVSYLHLHLDIQLLLNSKKKLNVCSKRQYVKLQSWI